MSDARDENTGSELRAEQERRLKEYEADPVACLSKYLSEIVFGYSNGVWCEDRDCDECPNYLLHDRIQDDIESEKIEVNIKPLYLVIELLDIGNMPVYEPRIDKPDIMQAG